MNFRSLFAISSAAVFDGVHTKTRLIEDTRRICKIQVHLGNNLYFSICVALKIDDVIFSTWQIASTKVAVFPVPGGPYKIYGAG